MAAYVIQYNKTDTLAATLNSGATSTTLTTGNFGSPSGTQLYVVDYDVPAKAEIISASITTTAVTSITRGLSGGAAGTTDHAIGAKIASIFVPQHYAALVDGTGFSTGTTSVGIPAAAVKQEAWTTYTPTWTASGTAPVKNNGTITGKYIQIGKTVHYIIYFSAGSTTTYGTGTYAFSLPVTAENDVVSYTGSAYLLDSGTSHYSVVSRITAGASTVVLYNQSSQQIGATNPFTFAQNDRIDISGTYQVA
jgi:hypothetical protein